MFLKWENNSGELQIIREKFQNSWKFQSNATNDVKQISLITQWIKKAKHATERLQ